MTQYLITAVLLFASVATAAAQNTRSLHWPRLDVTAHFDAEGRLQVRERHTMVFTGAWNGGERSFNLRAGQKLQLHGISRIEPNGNAIPLVRGDLAEVDEYDWHDRRTLRWRSRLPSDAEFVNQQIIYELNYTLSNILRRDGDTYRLDHDFAFPEREGIIEQFTLSLTAHDVWRSDRLPLTIERAELHPGASVVVNMPLRYTGAGAPAGVQQPPSFWLRLLLALVLVLALVTQLRSFYEHERARGRFEPLTPIEAIDREWLRTHIFSMPPEVVGALWDNSTAGPEVAAMIARMVQEGKLVSRVEPKKREDDVLHLELKVERSHLELEERRLIDSLFDHDRTTTSTERIRERYKKSGFDPASMISDGIRSKINRMLPHGAESRGWAGWLLLIAAIFVVLGGHIGLFVVAANNYPPLLGVTLALSFVAVVALILAGRYRGTVIGTAGKARSVTIALSIGLLIAASVVLGARQLEPPETPSLLLWIVVLYSAVVYLVLQLARTSEHLDRLATRRTLASAREYFKHELRKPAPQLEDAWYPYLLAFGLDQHIDKWFSAFGGQSAESGMVAAGVASSTSSSSGWSGGGPLFGGGGGFGGGGAGRSWATAATAMSSGVSAPSSGGSSGGGGGGGGGGSSGGGGGGGW